MPGIETWKGFFIFLLIVAVMGAAAGAIEGLVLNVLELSEWGQRIFKFVLYGTVVFLALAVKEWLGKR